MTDAGDLGLIATGAMPRIEQLFVAPAASGVDTMALERRAFVLRKRVEHAIVSYLLKRFAGSRNLDFYANYRRTSKNTGAGKVFEEIGFKFVADNDGVQSLVFKSGREIPDDHVINVVVSVANRQ